MIESADEFQRLRTSEDPAEYRRAAYEEATEAVWLDVIARFPEMRVWVAHNKTVPLSILHVLAGDEDRRVRSMVALKRKLDIELFTRLARDQDDSVRSTIAANPKIPHEVLVILSRDAEPFVADKAAARLRKVDGGGRVSSQTV